MKSAGMTSSGSPLSSIWCWASSTSSLPGWASSAFSSLWSSPLRAGIRATATAFVDGGQLFSLLGGRFGLSRRADIPRWMKSKAFRYGFLGFFLLMFFQMLWSTYLVFAGAQELRQAVTLLWTFRLPWHWAYYGTLFSPGVAQFAFGFYSVMLTSTVLGLVTMVLFKPRSWCVYCPMGTMTQLICRGKHRGEAALHSPAEGS